MVISSFQTKNGKKSIFRSSKILGITKIVIHLIWMIVGIIGVIYSIEGFNQLEFSVKENLKIVSVNIDLLVGLLYESIDVIETVEQSISTIEQSSIDAGLSLTDSRPMIVKTSQVVTQDIPNALDEVQTSMPSIMNAAGMIDHTLYLLSRFRFNIPVPFGNDIEINLGVDYKPEISLEDAIFQLSNNIEGIPQQMQSLEGDLGLAYENFGIMSENLIEIAYDLDLIRGQVAEIKPESQSIVFQLEEIQTSIDKSIERISITIRVIRNVIIILIVLMIISQIPSIFLGYFLSRGIILQPVQAPE